MFESSSNDSEDEDAAGDLVRPLEPIHRAEKEEPESGRRSLMQRMQDEQIPNPGLANVPDLVRVTSGTDIKASANANNKAGLKEAFGSKLKHLVEKKVYGDGLSLKEKYEAIVAERPSLKIKPAKYTKQHSLIRPSMIYGRGATRRLQGHSELPTIEEGQDPQNKENKAKRKSAAPAAKSQAPELHQM